MKGDDKPPEGKQQLFRGSRDECCEFIRTNRFSVLLMLLELDQVGSTAGDYVVTGYKREEKSK